MSDSILSDDDRPHGDQYDTYGLDADGRDPNGRANDDDTVRETIRASRPYWLTLVPVLLLLLAGTVLYLALGGRGEDSTSADQEAEGLQSEIIGSTDGAAATDDAAGGDTAAGSDDGTEADSGDQGGAATDQDDGAGAAAALLPPVPEAGPYVDATLTDNIFVLSGKVPSEDIKQAIEARAELAYAPFNASELTVDESVEPAEWLAAAPAVVGLLPMITDGTIRLQENAATLVGRSPTQFWADEFAGAVGALTGLPVTNDGVAITNLVPPRFVAEVEDGKVTLDGELPNQQILETFIGGAAAVYGAENVTSTMTIDEGTYTSFWNYTIPGAFALLQPFTSYRLQVEQAVFSGSMQGAILFELNSAEISDQAEQVLPIGIALIARDQNLKMTIIGHTDNTGSDEINQELSVDRAQHVVDFFVSNGIDPERLVADGKGSSEPIATNDTAEGRARNRRVEFLFSY